MWTFILIIAFIAALGYWFYIQWHRDNAPESILTVITDATNIGLTNLKSAGNTKDGISWINLWPGQGAYIILDHAKFVAIGKEDNKFYVKEVLTEGGKHYDIDLPAAIHHKVVYALGEHTRLEIWNK